jgi:prolyl oligopeptidase
VTARARAALAAVVVCAGAAASGEEAPRPPAAAPASIGGVEEVVHGRLVRDPFRGLEDREGADAWIRAQEARALAWWEAHPDPALDERLERLFATDRHSDPRIAGVVGFHRHLEGSKEQATLVATVEGRRRVLVDPNALDPEGRTALDWYAPSDDGRFVAYGLSKDGTEDSVLRVLEVATGKDRGVEIPDTRWCDVSWLPDASGFYYTRYPPGERYAPKVRFHSLSRERADAAAPDDPVVFGEGLDPKWFPSTVVSEDGDHVAFHVHRGWSATDVLVEDRKTGRRTTLVSGVEDERTQVVRMDGGTLFAWTNRAAPRGRLVRVPVDPETGALGAWTDVVAQGEHRLDAALYADGHWVLHWIDGGVSRLEVVAPDGARRAVALPEPLCEVYGLDADPRGTAFVFAYSSFRTPTAIVAGDAAVEGGGTKVVATVDVGVAADAFDVRRVRYPSTDGTLVPMRVIAPKGGASGPTLLTGYGGFDVSLGPSFDARALVWVERGGVFAEPNLRGGGEFGEEWHRAGARERKPTVFDDFESAMRWLIAEGLATPRTLAIEGGSNGGLLVGAMTTRCPELFSVAAGAVGLYDMVRYHLWPPAEIWADEYGSATDAAQTGWLLGYSPYHRVVPGVAYPAFLGTTGEQDERVSWRHTAKFVAALQAATSSDRPVLFHMETKVGHGQGKPRSERAREVSRIVRFLWAESAPAR